MTNAGGDTRAAAELERHVRGFFAGHPVRPVTYDLGNGMRGWIPALRILEVGPGPRADCWAYVSIGCWARAPHAGNGLEFVVTAPAADTRAADLLAMAAFRHCGPHPDPLSLGDSVPIGGPWLPGSACDHFLVSLPYLHGPALERCPVGGGFARFLWLLPITAAEARFVRAQGYDAFEEIMRGGAFNVADPGRASLV
jgi:hypothetical protein